MKTYRPWNPKTQYLLPPSMTDWLPDDHLVYFIIDVVADLDIGPFEATLQNKDRRGSHPHDPRMMVSLLLYAYCSGVYSSRRIAKATVEDELYGEGREAFEWPEEMKTREGRLKRLKEARESLEREAREQRAKTMREQADRMEKSSEPYFHEASQAWAGGSSVVPRATDRGPDRERTNEMEAGHA